MADFDIIATFAGRIAENLEPWVLQRSTTAQAITLLLDEQFGDQVLALIRNGVKLTMLKVVLAIFDLTEDFCRISTLEWQVTAHECIQEHTKRPDIGFLTVTALKHFRRHIVGRTCDRSQIFVVL